MKLHTNSSIQTDTHAGVKVKNFNVAIIDETQQRWDEPRDEHDDLESRDDYDHSHEDVAHNEEYSIASSSAESTLGLSKFASDSISDCNYLFRIAFSDDMSAMLLQDTTFSPTRAASSKGNNVPWWWSFGRQQSKSTVSLAPSLFDDEGYEVHREDIEHDPEVEEEPVGGGGTEEFQSLISCYSEASEMRIVQRVQGQEVMLDFDKKQAVFSSYIDESKPMEEMLDETRCQPESMVNVAVDTEIEPTVSGHADGDEHQCVVKVASGNISIQSEKDNQSTTDETRYSKGNESSVVSQLGQESMNDSEEETTKAGSGSASCDKTVKAGSAFSGMTVSGMKSSDGAKKVVHNPPVKERVGRKKKSLFGRFLSRTHLAAIAEDEVTERGGPEVVAGLAVHVPEEKSAVTLVECIQSPVETTPTDLANEVRKEEMPLINEPEQTAAKSKRKKSSFFGFKKPKSFVPIPRRKLRWDAPVAVTGMNFPVEPEASAVALPTTCEDASATNDNTSVSFASAARSAAVSEASIGELSQLQSVQDNGNMSVAKIAPTLHSRTVIGTNFDDTDEVEIHLVSTFGNATDGVSLPTLAGNPSGLGSASKSILDVAEVKDIKQNCSDITGSSTLSLSAAGNVEEAGALDVLCGPMISLGSVEGIERAYTSGFDKSNESGSKKGRQSVARSVSSKSASVISARSRSTSKTPLYTASVGSRAAVEMSATQGSVKSIQPISLPRSTAPVQQSVAPSVSSKSASLKLVQSRSTSKTLLSFTALIGSKAVVEEPASQSLSESAQHSAAPSVVSKSASLKSVRSQSTLKPTAAPRAAVEGPTTQSLVESIQPILNPTSVAPAQQSVTPSVTSRSASAAQSRSTPPSFAASVGSKAVSNQLIQQPTSVASITKSKKDESSDRSHSSEKDQVHVIQVNEQINNEASSGAVQASSSRSTKTATNPISAEAAAAQDTKDGDNSCTKYLSSSPDDVVSPSEQLISSQSNGGLKSNTNHQDSHSISIYGSAAEQVEVQSRSRHSKSTIPDNFATGMNDEPESQSPDMATGLHVKTQVPIEIMTGATQPTPFGLLSPNADVSGSEDGEYSMTSFYSAMTPGLTLSNDVQDNEMDGFGFFCRQPSYEEVQDVQDDKHARVEAPDLETKDQPKNTWFSFLCRQEATYPVENQVEEQREGVAEDSAVKEEGFVANNRTVNDAPPKANFLENACKAACQCIAQDEFADLLEDSMRVGIVRRQKKRPKSKKNMKKQIKKRSKKNKLLSPIREEAGDAVTPLPAPPNRESIISLTEQSESNPSNTQREMIDSHVAPPIQKKKRMFFNIFARKKRKAVSKEKDVLSLIQSDTFMAGIMNEIKMDIQQTGIASDIKNTDDVVKSDDLPDEFSELLAEQIAEEALKICLEDLR
ncbi:hypothetical protein ACHAWO_009141 [Cyclotella atomus]|uniref:Uncharacterized protein n=1 Tax=Cyclotella atomus TaxID=382360 RepID=A0ABD3PN47_9STRA